MKKKKDILFLCQFFYPEYISSATLPYDTAKALSQEGFSVGVLCGYPKEYNDSKNVLLKENHDGIEIRRLKYLQMKRSNFLGRLINYFSFTASVLTRFFSIRNYKSIIVYSNPPILPMVATLASKVFGTKMIFVSYDIYPEIAIRTNTISESSVISKTMRFINRSLYKNVTKVVALSYDMKKFLIRHRSQLNEKQIVVIPNWYEDRPNCDIESSYSNIIFENIKAKEKLVISYFGNMGTAQDINTLIDAMKIMKNDSDVSFIFAGHGNKLPFLKDVAQKEELKNVFIYDFLRGQDFQDALNISDVFVVSLDSGLTGLAVPSKTYSYMMAGKPIISIMSNPSHMKHNII
jgi:glycosyltransferase involved in cell wall biosynthesis